MHRSRLACLGSSSLLCASLALAADPALGPDLGSTKVSAEPARLQAEATQPSLVGVRPINPEEFWQRLERAESQISELQTENRKLRDQSFSEIMQAGYSPLHMAPLFAAHDPEIGIVREMTNTPVVEQPQSSDSTKSDGSKEKEVKKEAPKPKKWFDKLSLRGYAQFRLSEETHREKGSASAHSVTDRSIANDQNFLMRRARLTVSGDVHEQVYVYLQTDFAVTTPSSTDNTHFAQVRDWFADYYFDEEKELRLRIGQSKVPYGWENLQSSSNRIPFERTDALNSAVKNERDLGAFFFYTPTWAQDFFKEVLEKGLKGSGNYGLLGFGAYNGQGGSLLETNDDVHFAARVTLPISWENGQYSEVSLQGYTGEYTVAGTGYNSLKDGTKDATPTGTGTSDARARDGFNDQRLAASFIWYPQPFGFQSEWTVGNGPALNPTVSVANPGGFIENRSLSGGYAMLLYKYDHECWGTFFPYVRYSHYKGGYKSERNAPYAKISEWEFGTEWQVNPSAEWTLSYLVTDRTNTNALSSNSYRQYDGQFLRLQFQVNY